MTAQIGVLVASDRASSGEYRDRGGPAVEATLREFLESPFELETVVVPDDQETIERELIRLSDVVGCCLVITTGGTGPAPRDVTPDATETVCERILPGFGERMRAVSVDQVPTAILSRQLAGIRGKTLIVNLPGSPRAVRECLEAVFPAVPDCVDLLGGPRLETDPEVVRAYRPHR